MEDKWTIYVVCNGTEEGEQFHRSFSIEKSLLTLRNLITLKSKLGYGSRDYMYYKRRSVDDRESAILQEVEYDVDLSDMVDSCQDESEIRLVLSKNQANDLCVAITPIKKKKGSSDDEEDEAFDLDGYKGWLAYLHSKGEALGELHKSLVYMCMDFAMCTHGSYYCSFLELQDIYREDTINTFIERLKVQGDLDDISNILMTNYNSFASFKLCLLIM